MPRTTPSSTFRSCRTFSSFCLLLAFVALALSLPSLALASSLTEIDSYLPPFAWEGQPIYVTGDNIGEDATRYMGVIRDVGDEHWALAPATGTSGFDTVLDLEIWGGMHGFHGDLEVQVGELFPVAPTQISSGTRDYIIFGTEYFEATCHVDGGPFQVMAPPGPISFNTMHVGQQLWVNDLLPNASGIVRCAILASTPPPCGVLPLDANGEPMPVGPPTFTARTKIVQTSGGAPEDETARAHDMAMALNQAFGAIGLQATTQGEWLVLSTPYGLADSSFSLVECGEP